MSLLFEIPILLHLWLGQHVPIIVDLWSLSSDSLHSVVLLHLWWNTLIGLMLLSLHVYLLLFLHVSSILVVREVSIAAISWLLCVVLMWCLRSRLQGLLLDNQLISSILWSSDLVSLHGAIQRLLVRVESTISLILTQHFLQLYLGNRSIVLRILWDAGLADLLVWVLGISCTKRCLGSLYVDFVTVWVDFQSISTTLSISTHVFSHSVSIWLICLICIRLTIDNSLIELWHLDLLCLVEIARIIRCVHWMVGTIQLCITSTTPISVLSSLATCSCVDLVLDSLPYNLVLWFVRYILRANHLIIWFPLFSVVLGIAWSSSSEVEDVGLDGREGVIVGYIESCSPLILLRVVREYLYLGPLYWSIYWTSLHISDIIYTHASIVCPTSDFRGIKLLCCWDNLDCLIEVIGFSILTLSWSVLGLTDLVCIGGILACILFLLCL